MVKIRRTFTLGLVSLLLSAGSVFAQDPVEGESRTISLKVAFRQGKRQIDLSYMNNSANISNFTSTLQDYVYDSNIEVVSVDIIGGASIEGSAELNEDLSNNRAERMVEILRQYASVPQNKVHVDSRGVNWEDVLEMVENDVSVPSRERVMDILRNTPEQSRKSTLEKLDGGRPYKYMYANIFPYVRTGKMTVRFRLVPKEPAVKNVPDTVYIRETVYQKDTVYHVYLNDPSTPRNINQNILNVNTDRRGRRRGLPSNGEADDEYEPTRLDRLDTLLRVPILAARTNFLLPLMNIGVEIPIGNRWSISGDWNYPWWWRLPDHKDCFEFHGGTGEIRYWFGRRHTPGDENRKYRLLGHSIALVGGSGCYDFQEEWAGFQGEYGAVGIDYQYAMPIGKKANAHLEFDLTLGAITSRNIPYDVFSEGGVLLHRDGLVEAFSWFGPIKGGVSLVIPIFKKERVMIDNVNMNQ